MVSVRLSRFEVIGLFGQYDNIIPIHLDERITAIIGPNGRGKTVCLRLIDALYHRHFWEFSNVEYNSLCFYFNNGSSIEIIRENAPGSTSAEPRRAPSRMLPIRVTITNGDGSKEIWSPRLRSRSSINETIAKYLPFLSRITFEDWIDTRTSERVSVKSIAQKYKDQLPKDVTEDLLYDEPEAFSQLVDGVDCHLIETQRLMVVGSSDSQPAWNPAEPRRRPSEPDLVVHQKAKKLRNILQTQWYAYGTLSQRLERSFPKRVIQSRTVTMGREEITAKLQEIESRRTALMEAGILDLDFENFAAGDWFDDATARVLAVYIRDTEQKLKVFSDIFEKIDLFKDIVNSRFIDKHITADRENGIVVYKGKEPEKNTQSTVKVSSEPTEKKKRIPLERLSSGEQHQLILIFELLFEMKVGSLIMIDEPELSLHVSWQKKFISDLRRIIGVNAFDIIIATHSPQLIGRWFHDVAVELGDVDE